MSGPPASTRPLPFDLRVPASGSRSRLKELHRQLRGAIRDGRLAKGARLPATRALAAALGVSRNTVVALYDLLLAEGYLVARPGAGTFVNVEPSDALGPPPAAPRPLRRTVANVAAGRPGSRPLRDPLLADFRIGFADPALFPVPLWSRLAARALRTSLRDDTPSDPAGLPALRRAIAGHVAFTRAVACREADVVVTAGAQQAFDLIARTLVTPGQTVVAVEDPGYHLLRDAFTAAGAVIAPVPVDDQGLVVGRIPSEAAIVCVTPSHQFPTAVAMTLERRNALLEQVRRTGAVIVEDDYDSEFLFARRPVDALQTLDRGGAVVYVGTFSKSLSSALRLGFLVAPPWLREALVATRGAVDRYPPVPAQHTLAAFIEEGHLARHLRRARRVYAARHARLGRGLEERFGEFMRIVPSDGGLHLCARVDDALDARALTEAACRAGIAVESCDDYALAARAGNLLAFGLGRCPEPRIDDALAALGRGWPVPPGNRRG